MNTKTINATFSMSYQGEAGVNISIKDEASGITFVDLLLSNEEFTRALSSLQERPAVHCKVRWLQHVGKTRETSTTVMYYNGELPSIHKNPKEAAEVLVEEAKSQGLAAGGWRLSAHYALNAQGGRGVDEHGKWYKIQRIRFVDQAVQEQPGEAEC